MIKLNTRTIGLFVIGLILIGVIIHVFWKDLLGLNSQFHVTSPFIMALGGAILLLLPSVLRGTFQPILKVNESLPERRKIYDMKTFVVTVITMVAVALAIDYSGLIPQFDLDSAIRTLGLSVVLFLIIGISKKFGDGKVGAKSSFSATESGKMADA